MEFNPIKKWEEIKKKNMSLFRAIHFSRGNGCMSEEGMYIYIHELYIKMVWRKKIEVKVKDDGNKKKTRKKNYSRDRRWRQHSKWYDENALRLLRVSNIFILSSTSHPAVAVAAFLLLLLLTAAVYRNKNNSKFSFLFIIFSAKKWAYHEQHFFSCR